MLMRPTVLKLPSGNQVESMHPKHAPKLLGIIPQPLFDHVNCLRLAAGSEMAPTAPLALPTQFVHATLWQETVPVRSGFPGVPT